MTSLLEKANSKENRENFLNRLEKASGRKRHQLADNPLKAMNSVSADLLADKSEAELMEIAKKNSESVNAEVVIKKSSELADYLRQYTSDKDVKNMLLAGVKDDVWSGLQLSDWVQNSGVATVNKWSADLDRMDNEQNANLADLAIAMGEHLIASTGTATIANSAAQGRGFLFLPTRLLVIIPKSGLVKNTREAVEKYDEAFENGLSTSAINFISGPSNSGDIEMELVVGVHGPVECTYLVVEDK
ncbi:MAG: lactate utilization protein C [Limosilactobacillus sp.]|uniref:LutC/YkgG family protein n=1 Tax=Limosilactobacillus sp. TaxID=2773925 RepID=UPI0027030C6A|nr:lactate utilization protein C [Limosilactobacillus sp.]